MQHVSIMTWGAAETMAGAEAFSGGLRRGAVVGLLGDLGSGKTQWVKGMARGLGYHGRVHSPTFALVHVYRGGRLPLYHWDLYRLGSDAEIEAAGLTECWDADGVTVIEWADRWKGERPAAYLQVRFDVLAEEVRRITYEHPGT